MFKVYGKNPESAKKKALKKVQLYVMKDGVSVRLTDEQYEKDLEESADAIFKKMKAEAVSSEIATPETCEQFIRMAEKSGCTELQVRIKCPVQSVDSKGRAKVVQRFLPYVHGNNYSDPVKNAAVKF